MAAIRNAVTYPQMITSDYGDCISTLGLCVKFSGCLDKLKWRDNDERVDKTNQYIHDHQSYATYYAFHFVKEGGSFPVQEST